MIAFFSCLYNGSYIEGIFCISWRFTAIFLSIYHVFGSKSSIVGPADMERGPNYPAQTVRGSTLLGDMLGYAEASPNVCATKSA